MAARIKGHYLPLFAKKKDIKRCFEIEEERGL